MQRAQFQLLNLKRSCRGTKEKTQGKTVQEIDREKLEEKFSKDKKETLN
jgi:small subunit ribosomal protein S2